MDKSLVYNIETKDFDIQYDSDGRCVTDSLETQIYQALFSDDRANKSEISQAERRKGYWGTLLGDNHGSKLWLNNGRKTNQNLSAIIDYAKKSLIFLVKNGKLNNIEVDGGFSDDGIYLDITLTYLNNQKNKLTLEV